MSLGRQTRALAAATIAAAAAAALAGCGAAREGEPTDRARSAVQAFLHVCSEGEGEAALDLLSEPARVEFLKASSPVDGCQRILGAGVGGPGADLLSEGEESLKEDFDEARVSQVGLYGGFGAATVEIAGRSVEVELESKGSDWSLTKTRLSG